MSFSKATPERQINKTFEKLKKYNVSNSTQLDHLICLLRNLYASQEATVRTGHGTTDCFQIGKGVHIFYIYCHPAYLTYMHSTS